MTDMTEMDEALETKEKETPKRIVNKRTRALMRRRKLRKLYEETKNIYGVGAYFDHRKNRIVKDSVNRSDIRRDCNRRFRRRLNSNRYEKVDDGAAYRKYEEYWWSVI